MPAIFGFVELVYAALLRRQHPIPASLLALGLASAVAVITWIILLACFGATSFPAANLLYTSPASPLVIIFTVVGIYAGSSIVLRRNCWLHDG